jgi:hypothetical protein
MTNTNTVQSDARQSLLHYLEGRLLQWAEWYQAWMPVGIGFPPCTVEYRLANEAYVARRNPGRQPLLSNPAADAMEELIMQMAKQHQELASILRHYYLSANDLMENKARRYGMSKAQYSTYLTIARWWLIARLTEKLPSLPEQLCSNHQNRVNNRSNNLQKNAFS